jgi:hypothetical protein
MAKEVLAGKYPPGTTVHVDVDRAGTLVFRGSALN